MERTIASFQNMLIEHGPYDLWATITFRRIRGVEGARKGLKGFLKRLNTPEETFINNFLFCFVLYDTGNGRKGVHIHALIRGIHPLKAESFQKRCAEEFGRSEAMPYQPSINPNATLYLAQKFARSTLADWEFIKVNPFKHRKSLMRRQRVQL